MSLQSKRARFAHKQRFIRLYRAITMANKLKPGFVGVVTNLRIGELKFGAGALFITSKT